MHAKYLQLHMLAPSPTLNLALINTLAFTSFYPACARMRSRVKRLVVSVYNYVCIIIGRYNNIILCRYVRAVSCLAIQKSPWNLTCSASCIKLAWELYALCIMHQLVSMLHSVLHHASSWLYALHYTYIKPALRYVCVPPDLYAIVAQLVDLLNWLDWHAIYIVRLGV